MKHWSLPVLACPRDGHAGPSCARQCAQPISLSIIPCAHLHVSSQPRPGHADRRCATRYRVAKGLALAAGGLPRLFLVAGLGRTLDRVAADLAGVLRAPRSESDIGAGQPALYRRHHLTAGERAGDELEILLEHQLALRQLPGAVDLGRHEPEEGVAIGL